MVKWETVKLGSENLAQFDYENLSSDTDQDYSFKYITLENIDNGKLIKYIDCVYKTSPSRARRIVNKGDLLISTVRPNLHSHYKVDKNVANVICSTGFCVIKTDETRLNKDFLYSLFYSDIIDKQIELIVAGSSYPAINSNDIKQLEIPLPPLHEQRRIATVLSDTDELIAKLEKLIAKKKAIKQGTMQELLTGKRRLPGFSGEWVEKPLSDLFDFYGGLSASRAQLSDMGFPYLHYGDIHGSTKTFVDVCNDHSIPRIDIEINKVSNVSLLNDGDVVFVDASEDDGGASRYVVVRNGNNLTFISGLHTIIAKSKTDELNNLFKEFCFQATDIKTQFKFYAVGTKVMGVNKTTIGKILLYYPETKHEQAAIANVLSDMEKEIVTLTAKLNKLKHIKQGMMSELLTGRIRLVQSETVDERAVIIAGIVNRFYHPQYPLGRFKVQKLFYLLGRHQGKNTSNFKEKAAGPYDEKLRYDVEPVAIENGYIMTEEGIEGTLFFIGTNIQNVLKYIKENEMSDDFRWLTDIFLKKSAEELELLSTVDWVKEKLRKRNEPISLVAVKQYIQESEEWKEKLDRPLFSDKNISSAVKWSNDLFGQEANQ